MAVAAAAIVSFDATPRPPAAHPPTNKTRPTFFFGADKCQIWILIAGAREDVIIGKYQGLNRYETFEAEIESFKRVTRVPDLEVLIPK